MHETTLLPSQTIDPPLSELPTLTGSPGFQDLSQPCLEMLWGIEPDASCMQNRSGRSKWVTACGPFCWASASPDLAPILHSLVPTLWVLPTLYGVSFWGVFGNCCCSKILLASCLSGLLKHTGVVWAPSRFPWPVQRLHSYAHFPRIEPHWT